MIINAGIGEAWLVVFSEPDPILPGDWRAAKRRDRVLYRLLRWLKPGFRHVWAMKRAEHFNGWLALNTTSNGVHLFEIADHVAVHVPDDWGEDMGEGEGPGNEMQRGPLAGRTFVDYHDFLMAMEDAGLVRLVVVPVQPGHHWRFRGLFTCVGAVKHILGIEAWRVWTPWQLHQHLIKGARVKGGNDGR